MRLSDSLGQICKLVGNLGPADKSTNFILEQRNLLRSQADEDRDIRDAIKDEVSKITVTFLTFYLLLDCRWPRICSH